AMSIAGLGYPIGEAVLPTLAVVLMGAFGWRMVWFGIGVFLLAVALPVTQLLLRGHAERHKQHLSYMAARRRSSGSASGPAQPGASVPNQRQWSLGEVLRGWLFWLMLPVVVAPGFIVTGFFFHQNHLVETKGWSAEWFATSFAIFAAGQLAVGLAAGPLVDRYSGARLLAYFTLPLAVALALLGASNDPFIAAVFMLGLGVTAGLAPTVVGSMWAELYGVQHLGAIRSMATSVMVFGTAASPALMGSLIDKGVTMEHMAWASAAYVVLASALALVAVRRRS
ncbi:MAG: MFS transporter, partial [Longimicrobiales bacterium]